MGRPRSPAVDAAVHDVTRKGMTIKQAAERHHCGARSVAKRLQEMGWKRRPTYTASSIAIAVARVAGKRATVRTAAHDAGCSQRYLQRLLREARQVT